MPCQTPRKCEPCPTPWLCGRYSDSAKWDDSPTLDDSAFGYWPRESQTRWDREQADTPPYEAEAAMAWPYVLLMVVLTAVFLGSLAAFALENWALIEQAVADFWK